MNSQPHLNPTLAPANHTAAFAGLVGQQQTPAIQARSMLPPPLPQPRLAPHNQFRGWAPGLFFPIQLDRTYNLFPVVPQNHPRGSLDLSMAPPDFFTNYWATEPRWDLNLDQLRALVASQDRVAREAPAQQVQSNQAAPALQAPPAIPAWRLLYQVSPFEWGLAEVLQVRKFDSRASPADRMLTEDSFRSLRHHPVYALLGSKSPAIARPCCSGFVAE